MEVQYRVLVEPIVRNCFRKSSTPRLLHFLFGNSLINRITRCFFDSQTFLPAALRAAQACRYWIYSEADFEVFRPAGATRCTDGGEIWHAKFHPHRCNDKGVGPQKLKFLLIFDRNVEYKRPAGRIPCAIFTKFAEFVPHFRASGVKIWLDLRRGYGLSLIHI